MIISRQLSDQIVQNWPVIKYGAIMANGIVDSDIREEYCRNLLCNLLSGKYSCWLCIDDSRNIMGIAITKLYKDLGNIPHLLIESVYVYDAVTDAQRLEFIRNIKMAGTELGCKDIIFYTSNERIINVASKLGFSESYRVYCSSIGGM